MDFEEYKLDLIEGGVWAILLGSYIYYVAPKGYAFLLETMGIKSVYFAVPLLIYCLIRRKRPIRAAHFYLSYFIVCGLAILLF